VDAALAWIRQTTDPFSFEDLIEVMMDNGLPREWRDVRNLANIVEAVLEGLILTGEVRHRGQKFQDLSTKLWQYRPKYA
jgi:hypothetical protein